MTDTRATDFWGAPVDEPVTDEMLDAALGTLAAYGLKPKEMSDGAYRMNMRRIIGEALTARRRAANS